MGEDHPAGVLNANAMHAMLFLELIPHKEKAKSTGLSNLSASDHPPIAWTQEEAGELEAWMMWSLEIWWLMKSKGWKKETGGYR